jgi:hypothetical protein
LQSLERNERNDEKAADLAAEVEGGKEAGEVEAAPAVATE